MRTARRAAIGSLRFGTGLRASCIYYLDWRKQEKTGSAEANSKPSAYLRSSEKKKNGKNAKRLLT